MMRQASIVWQQLRLCSKLRGARTRPLAFRKGRMTLEHARTA